MRWLRNTVLVVFGSLALTGVGSAAPAQAGGAELLRIGGSSADAFVMSGGDGCLQTTMYALAADTGSSLLDSSVGADQIYLTFQQVDQCSYQTFSYFNRVGDLEPGALTISADHQTASLRTSFDTYDYAVGHTVHVDLSLAWTNRGEHTLQLDQRHQVHEDGTRLLQRFDYDSWKAGVQGSLSIDGRELLSSSGASFIDGNIGADQTSQVLIEKMAALAAATASGSPPITAPSDMTYGYARWGGGDGSCQQSRAEIYAGTDKSTAALTLTVGRWNACTGEYSEWISSGWDLGPDDVKLERGGSAMSVTKTLQAISSVTLQPVTIELRIRWDGDIKSWDTFASHQLSPDYRIHYSSTTRPATPTAEITVGGLRFELGTLEASYIVRSSTWIKANH